MKKIESDLFRGGKSSGKAKKREGFKRVYWVEIKSIFLFFWIINKERRLLSESVKGDTSILGGTRCIPGTEVTVFHVCWYLKTFLEFGFYG